MIASAINERTRRKLDYALEENRILKEPKRAPTEGSKTSLDDASAVSWMREIHPSNSM